MAIPAIIGLGGMWVAIKGFFLGSGGVVASITMGQLAVAAIQKTLFLGLIFIALPVLAYRLILFFMDFFIDLAVQWALDAFSTYDLGSEVLELSGIGGYIATEINLIEAFGIFITGHLIRMTINIIPETINPLRR